MLHTFSHAWGPSVHVVFSHISEVKPVMFLFCAVKENLFISRTKKQLRIFERKPVVSRTLRLARLKIHAFFPSCLERRLLEISFPFMTSFGEVNIYIFL